MSRPTSPKPTSLTLIRHAEVAERYHSVFGGSRIDMELSPLGERQARRLADHLEGVQFDAIYASPMQRAQQTLAPIAAHQKARPVTMPGLAEVDFGDWTGLNWAQLEEKFGVSAYEWLDKMHSAAIPGGESADMFRARVEPCLQQILRQHPEQSVAIVCHGGVVRMILSILLEFPLPRMSLFDVEYASITQVERSPNKTKIHLMNLTPWRDLK